MKRISCLFFLCMLFVVSYGQQVPWVSLGPYENTGTHMNGTGRVQAIAFDPDFIHNHTMYVASPFGGLWKSIDGGSHWSNRDVSTDKLPVCGVAAIVVDPKNGKNLYIATGDDDDINVVASTGVYKSTDGGRHWQNTGLSFKYQDNKQISALLIAPWSSQTLFACTSDGVYRSADAGTTWKLTLSDGHPFKSIAIIPGSSSRTIYAGGADVYASKDGGRSWISITKGRGLDLHAGVFTNKKLIRTQLAVCPDSTLYAVIATADTIGYGYKVHYYFYYFDGQHWQKRTPVPPQTPSYTETRLALTVSPFDKHTVFAGQAQVFRSSDGGKTPWTMLSTYGGNVHPDIRVLKFAPDNKSLYVTTDGGVYKTDNPFANARNIRWQEADSGLCISTVDHFDVGQTAQAQVLVGMQDNGTALFKNGHWKYVLTGDGDVQLIDRSDSNNMYSSVSGGYIKRSTNGGKWWNAPFKVVKDDGDFYDSPLIQDPADSNVLYFCREHLWRSSDKGVTWNPIAQFTVDHCINYLQFITTVAVAPSDDDVIYAGARSVHLTSSNPPLYEPPFLFRTRNGGGIGDTGCPDWTYWKDVTPRLPHESAEQQSKIRITGIAVSSHSAKKLWITLDDPLHHLKVQTSKNGGRTWKDDNAGLPDLPVYCIVYDNESNNDDVYVGTAIGIYHKNASMQSWQPFMKGLPNVRICELRIDYVTHTLNAGTFGRGTWLVPLSK